VELIFELNEVQGTLAWAFGNGDATVDRRILVVESFRGVFHSAGSTSRKLFAFRVPLLLLLRSQLIWFCEHTSCLASPFFFSGVVVASKPMVNPNLSFNRDLRLWPAVVALIALHDKHGPPHQGYL
jgi:hypothetical protein